MKFWFKYGLMLCAIGMLQDERPPRRNGNTVWVEDGEEKTDGPTST